MTWGERELLLLLAKTMYGGLDTPFPLRRKLRELMEKVAADDQGPENADGAD